MGKVKEADSFEKQFEKVLKRRKYSSSDNSSEPEDGVHELPARKAGNLVQGLSRVNNLGGRNQ